MKKIKVLPSILMLIACIAILGVGVFAVAPTQNTISGQITINTANTPISIQLFVDGQAKGEPEIIRAGKIFEVGDLVWETTNVNTIDELSEKRITFKIQNLSTTQSLGAYFFKNGSTVASDNLATGENIMLEEFMFVDEAEETEANKVATVSCTPYMYIARYDDEGTNTVFDTIEMTMRLNAYQFFDTAKTATLDYTIKIEPYQANIAPSAENNPYNLPVITPGTVTASDSDSWDLSPTVTNGSTTFTQSLLKLPEENYTTIAPASFYGNTSIEYIVVPSNVTESEFVITRIIYDCFCYIGDLAFSCPNLKAVGWCADVLPSLRGISTNSWDSVYCSEDRNFSAVNDGIVLSINAHRIQSITFTDGTNSEETLTVFNWNINISKIYMTNVVSIANETFNNCTNITVIEIPSGVTSIGSSAFSGCTSLNSITIKSGLDLTTAYTLPTLTKTGYTFNGWYANEEGTGDTIIEISADKYTEDTTYYAVWTAK